MNDLIITLNTNDVHIAYGLFAGFILAFIFVWTSSISQYIIDQTSKRAMVRDRAKRMTLKQIEFEYREVNGMTIKEARRYLLIKYGRSDAYYWFINFKDFVKVMGLLKAIKYKLGLAKE